MSQQNNIDLLKPIDMTKIKVGDLVTDASGQHTYEFLGQGKSMYGDAVAVRLVNSQCPRLHIIPTSELRTVPLAWVEDKPVYPGTELYWTSSTSEPGSKFVVGDKILPNSIIAGISYCPSGRTYGEDGNGGMLPETLTWEPPKKKKEIKLLAFIDDHGYLRWIREDKLVFGCFKRVPSEDKIILLDE